MRATETHPHPRLHETGDLGITKFKKGGGLWCLGTPSGKGYRTPFVLLNLSVCLSVSDMGRLKEGPGR